MDLFLAVCTALATAAAWWYPGTPVSAALGWTGALFLAALFTYAKRRFLSAYLCGALTYTLGFYWLFWTIQDFGGFNSIAAGAVFALFAFGEAVQFLLVAVFVRFSPRKLREWDLDIPLAWIAAERLWIRIFPWEVGHTQISFTHFVQIADLVGTPLITFVVLWTATAFARRTRPKVQLARLLAPLCAVACSVMYGAYRIETLPAQFGPARDVALIQGNVSLAEKHNVKYFTVNRELYKELSARISQPGLLIIWPETVITDPVSVERTTAVGSSVLPYRGDGSAFLVGSLTYNRSRELFNSAVAIQPDGSILPPSHKIILMPFGEYMPFTSWFPWIADLNPNAGGFTAGTEVGMFPFAFKDSTVTVSPLICYEDVLPNMARMAANRGSDLLVNLTNDAWFGRTVAPYQHHLIATFRAIENRRYLLRSTNTGLTAVVDPFGRTVAELPIYTEGILQTSIHPIGVRTPFTSITGEMVWQLLAYTWAVLLLISLSKQARSRSHHK